MKRLIAGHVSIARLAALALTALCVLQAPVRAATFAEYIIILPPVGLAPDQSLRLTLFNPEGAPVRAEARIHGAGGNILLGDGSVRFVQAGTFQSFDFKRSDIPLAGEENTGRVQLHGSVRLTFSRPINPVVASMEVISISDGTSNTFLVGEVLPRPTGDGGIDILIGGSTRDVLMGIAPGQTLRVTVFNPQSSRSEPLPSRVILRERNGSLIAQSDELVIPPGEFRSFDFDRNVIPLQGEPGTNRLQVLIKPLFNIESGRPAAPSEDRLLTNLISFEVIDNSTGKTVVLSGQECLVFFLGGNPNNLDVKELKEHL